MIAYGNFLFRHRNWVFPFVMIALFLGLKPIPAGGSPTTDLWLDLAGIVVVLAGEIVRGAVVGLVYIKRGGLQKKVYAADLVTDGMFAHGRNPLYVGNLLMLAGYLLIHNNPWIYVLGGLFFLTAYHAIVAAEEAYLRDKFGDGYDAYCRDTPRWRIRLRGLGKTFHGMEFNWARVFIKDYSTMNTAAITVIFLLGWQAVIFQGMPDARGALIALGATLIIVQITALGIRVLKKTGRIKA